MKKRLFVGICLDASGSMNHLRHTVVDQCNATLKTLREEAAATGIETVVMVTSFHDNTVHVMVQPSKISEVNGIYASHYYPTGGTPMFDGVGYTIEHLKAQRYAKSKAATFLLVVLTDGEENTSRNYTRVAFSKLLRDHQKTDQWTFAFQVPPGYTRTLTAWGVPEGNIREWEGTTRGLIETQTATNSSLRGFTQAVAKSARPSMSVASFYVQTDLSKVSAKQVHQKLDDISDRFKILEVPKEAPVKEFVEAKLKAPYVVGQAYYQLMKTEKVQPQKAVLIVEKGKKAVWGGQQARDLIGLPQGVEAKVTPGNHANYDIFVQSTSTNRKLPRGTKVLVDKALTKGLKPTWEAPKP